MIPLHGPGDDGVLRRRPGGLRRIDHRRGCVRSQREVLQPARPRGQGPGPGLRLREGHPGVHEGWVRRHSRGRVGGDVPRGVHVYWCPGQMLGFHGFGLRGGVRRNLGLCFAPPSEARRAARGASPGAQEPRRRRRAVHVLQARRLLQQEGRPLVYGPGAGSDGGAGRGRGVIRRRYLDGCRRAWHGVGERAVQKGPCTPG